MTAPTVRVQNLLLGTAALVVIVAGLRVAEKVALPVVFALLLAAFAAPGVARLRRHGVPKTLAVVLVMVGVGIALFGFGALLVDSVASFTASIDQYQGAFDRLVSDSRAALVDLGVPESALETQQVLTGGFFLGAIRQGLASVIGLLSNVLIVVVTTGFVLLEASDLELKLAAAFGPSSPAVTTLGEAADKVQRYLALKTVVSAFTGVLAGLLCSLLGLPFAVLWGLVAFLLNYVPAIGSLVAAAPPVALAAVAIGPGRAVMVAVGYLVINVVIGNILDPRLMGRRLGLSPLVVLLSLFFWGFVWGPAGMLLSVPMMVVAKLLLESSDSTRWVAVLMSSGREAEDITG